MRESKTRSGTRAVRASGYERPTSRSRTSATFSERHKSTRSSEKAEERKPKREKLFQRGSMDYTLLFLIILIVVVGLIMLLSASAPSGKRIYDDSYYYFKRQLFFIVLGFVGMIAISRINLNKLIPHVPKAFWICVALLVLVLIPGIGVKVNGARRWINLFGIQLQPSEFMKPIIAMYIAYHIRNKTVDLSDLRGNLFCGMYIGLVAILLMLETHLSGTIVIIGIAVCVMIAGGTPAKYLGIGIGGLGGLAALYLCFDRVRAARIFSLFNPFADAQGAGYQISQSIYAIGSGKFFGLGLGESVQKYSNLPEPYNDFIFSIICEELGFIGATIVILLFAALFLQSIRIALKAPDVWSSLTCVGIAAQIGIQAVFNMGVAVCLIPNTGVSLPFFSYGGTSVMTLLFEMGILLNVSRKSVK